jgi:adenylate cyclase
VRSTLRSFALAVAGSIGLIADIYACVSARLTPVETAINASHFGTGIFVSCIFLILLEKELRERHSLERSLEAEKSQSETLLQEIEVEKEQSETLLKAILPQYVIKRIREGSEYVADAVFEADVIFIDIVGFSAMSTRLGPKHLIEILGMIFKSFDENCERHGVIKIKTIGDSYMAATNLPDPSEGSGVRAVDFCHDALLSVHNIARKMEMPIDVRIGVATGAVVAGVLSLKRPAYDLWGETVNLASRMESTGEPGRIQIAEKTYWRIKNRFECEARGVVDVKGVGAVKTYFIR